MKRVAKRGSDWLTFVVKVTGIGMTPGQQSHMFGVFKQADLSTAKQFGSVGLGLALCKDLCAMMGGDIHLKSKAGKGSTFTIELPADIKISGLKDTEN